MHSSSARGSELELEIVSPLGLNEAAKAAWDQLRDSDPQLFSPFLSREFSELVSSVRPNTRVAVFSEAGGRQAFLPFEAEGNYGFPVARMINDAQAVVGDGELVDWQRLMEVAGVTAFIFHAHLRPQPNHFFEHEVVKAFLCDLTQTPDGYLPWLKKHSKTVAKQKQKTNKLKREIGDLKFEFACSDHETLDRMIELKSQQYRRTNIYDKFAIDWIRKLLHLLLDSTGRLRGQLSVLWAGEQMVAAHFGIREQKLLHYWFPVYDQAFHLYSPGTALFMDVVRACEAEGVEKIDFGYGELPYKWKLCNVITEMHHGVYCRSIFLSRYLKARHQARLALKQLPAKQQLKAMGRRLFPSLDAWEHGG